jgi:type I restriction enzyme S subunit
LTKYLVGWDLGRGRLDSLETQHSILPADLPTDFKKTEIGYLPRDWDLVRLGDLFEMQQGKAVSRKNRVGLSPKPFLRTANVFWGRLELATLDMMDFTDKETQKLALLPGDLLVCEGGDIGRTALWQGEIEGCYYQNHIHRLRASNPNVEPGFYMYWMQAALRLLRLYEGAGNRTTIPNLSKARLGSFYVPLPSLPEQQAIARVLRTVQEAIEATEKVIEATRELKRSLMAHLFTYGPVPVDEADRVPLKKTEIGSVPEHWRVVGLGEVSVQAQYGVSKRGEAHGGYPILRMNNLQGGRVNFDSQQYVDLDAKTLAKFRLRKDDLLFNRTNSYELVGKTALFDLDGEYVFASYLVRLVTDATVLNPRFANYYLNAGPTQARLKLMASRGVSQSNINATKLKSLLIPLPPLPEQEGLVNVLQMADKKIDAEEDRRQALNILFKTLLHDLMTGKVRVDNLNSSEVEGVV